VQGVYPRHFRAADATRLKEDAVRDLAIADRYDWVQASITREMRSAVGRGLAIVVPAFWTVSSVLRPLRHQ